MSRITVIIALVIALLVGSLGWAVSHYRSNAITYKQQRDAASQEVKLAKATISDMQTRQRDVAALDAKYTGELANAQATIDQLERDVASGKRRLQLNITTVTAKGNSSGTTGVDDATTARLTDSAERDYFTLRQRIETSNKMILGLQEYINTQCLK